MRHHTSTHYVRLTNYNNRPLSICKIIADLSRSPLNCACSFEIFACSLNSLAIVQVLFSRIFFLEEINMAVFFFTKKTLVILPVHSLVPLSAGCSAENGMHYTVFFYSNLFISVPCDLTSDYRKGVLLYTLLSEIINQLQIPSSLLSHIKRTVLVSSDCEPRSLLLGHVHQSVRCLIS